MSASAYNQNQLNQYISVPQPFLTGVQILDSKNLLVQRQKLARVTRPRDPHDSRKDCATLLNHFVENII